MPTPGGAFKNEILFAAKRVEHANELRLGEEDILERVVDAEERRQGRSLDSAFLHQREDIVQQLVPVGYVRQGFSLKSMFPWQEPSPCGEPSDLPDIAVLVAGRVVSIVRDDLSEGKDLGEALLDQNLVARL